MCEYKGTGYVGSVENGYNIRLLFGFAIDSEVSWGRICSD